MGPLLWVRGELRTERGDFVTDSVELATVARVAECPADERGDLAHLGLAHPRRGDRRGAEPEPAGDERRAGVPGDLVLVARHAGAVEGLLGHFAGQLGIER